MLVTLHSSDGTTDEVTMLGLYQDERGDVQVVYTHKGCGLYVFTTHPSRISFKEK